MAGQYNTEKDKSTIVNPGLKMNMFHNDPNAPSELKVNTIYYFKLG